MTRNDTTDAPTRTNRTTRYRAPSALAALCSLAVALSLAGGCTASPPATPAPSTPTESQTAPQATAPPAGTTAPPAGTTIPDATKLETKDLVVGTGATAQPGDTLTVHYTGWLANGTKFDSSLDRNEPFQFVLGQGRVIEGWDKGFAGMKVGGKRELIIPPQMGYGTQGAGADIPPNATLRFEVELLAVAKPAN